MKSKSRPNAENQEIKDMVARTEVKSLYISERILVETRDGLNIKIAQVRALLKKTIHDYYWDYKYSLKSISDNLEIPINTLHLYIGPSNQKFKCIVCGEEKIVTVMNRSDLKKITRCSKCKAEKDDTKSKTKKRKTKAKFYRLEKSGK